MKTQIVEQWLQSKILDEDDLESDSEIYLATQSSVKTYIDNSIIENNNTYVTNIVNEATDPDNSPIYEYIDGTEATLTQGIEDGDDATLVAANAYTDTLTSNGVTIADIQAYSDSDREYTDAADTATLNSATTYTDQEIDALPFDFSKSYIEYEQDMWYASPIPVTSLKIKRDIKDPDFEKFTDDGNGSDGLYTYSFSANKEQEVFINTVIDTRWRPGTSIYPAVRWQPTTAGGTGDTVKWGLEYHVRDFGQPMTNSTIITSEVSQPDETYTAGSLYVNIFAPIDMSAYTLGAMPEIAGRFYRSGDTDSYSGDAYLFCFGFIYRIFRPGCLIGELPTLYGV